MIANKSSFLVLGALLIIASSLSVSGGGDGRGTLSAGPVPNWG